MSEELKYKLYTSTDCIPEQTMFDYIDGKLSPKEQHAVEKHMLDCELCADAMEGLRMIKDRSHIAAINKKVSERIAAPADKKVIPFRYKMTTAIAAGLALMIGSVFVFYYFLYNQRNDAIVQMEEKAKQNTYSSDQAAPMNESAANEESPPPPPAVNKQVTDESKPLEDKEESAEAPARKLNNERITEKPDAPEDEVFKTNENPAAGATIPLTAADPAKTEYGYSVNKTFGAIKQESTNTLETETDLNEVQVSDRRVKVNAKAKNDAKYYEKEQQEQTETKNPATTSALKKEEKNKDKANAEEDKKTPAVSGENSSYSPGAENVVMSGISMDSIAANGKGDANADFEFAKAVDRQPEYPGGNAEMLKFIHKNFQYSGASYKAEDIPTTKIIVEFIVDKKGAIKNAKIKKGINAMLDKEALRVINSMPKWNPATKNGKSVDAPFILPILLEFR